MPRPTPASQRDAHRLVDAAELLDRDAQPGEAPSSGRPGAAVLLRGGQAEEAELAHLLHDVGREVVIAVPLARRAARSRLSAKSRTVRRNSSCSRDSSNVMPTMLARQVNDC